MKSTKSILFLLSLFLISNCGENLIEEVKERYDDGNMKVVEYYKKVGDTQTLVKKREYYETGEVEEESYYVNGTLEGKYTEYYKNGKIEEEGTFKDGELDGKFTEYYETGELEEEYYYVNGELEGKYFHYNKEGSIKKEEIYKNGELVE